MNDPDVVLTIDRNANGLAEDPMIGERLGPHGIDFKSWRLNRGGLDGGLFIKQRCRNSQGGEEHE